MTTITPEPPGTVGLPDLAAQVAELREIVGRMTPGEWHTQRNIGHFDTASDIAVSGKAIAQCLSGYPQIEHDATGIVALRNTALPLIDAQAAEIARLREVLQTARDGLTFPAPSIGAVVQFIDAVLQVQP